MIFEKKIVLVTGARGGIGRAISEMFAIRGATVIGTATDINGVKKINMYLGDKGTGKLLNVTQQQSINTCLSSIQKEFGNIDILINNAGIIRDNILLYMKEDDWQTVIDVNLTAAFRISKVLIKPMIKKRYGRIINIGSIVGITGNAGQSNYSASKSGLTGFTKSLAREIASRGITVNLVIPGFIDTGMTKTLTNIQKNDILSRIPMSRFGNPKDVAHAVIFLASDHSEYITGETIHVNGGMYME